MKLYRALFFVLLGLCIVQGLVIRSQSQQINRYAEEVDDRADAPAVKP